MSGFILEKKMMLLLMGAVCLSASLAGQTVIVNTVPAVTVGGQGAEYSEDVDSGIMDVLFDRGFIIFSQSTDDSRELLLSTARNTGADMVLTWKMEGEAVSGMLLDCKTGDVLRSVNLSVEDVDNPVENLHRTYVSLGEKLCDHLVPESWN